jgi:hypothetical protein
MHRDPDRVDSVGGRCRPSRQGDLAGLQHQFRDLLLVEGQYGGLEAPDINRLKELEHENGWLKRMFADGSS